VKQQQGDQDYEALCLLCGHIIDVDHVHIIAGKVGGDFDVLCPECFARYRNARDQQDADAETLDL
jgi:hypothetical protein